MREIFLFTLFLCVGFSAFSQITGVVKDSERCLPLQNVNVYKKNSSQGTTTNTKGFFYLKTATLGDTLVFSHIGFSTETIIVLNKEMNVLLRPNKIALPAARIYARKEKTKVINNPWVIDYLVVNDSTLLTAKVGSAGSIVQLNIGLFVKKKYHFSGIENFKKDCLGNIYIQTKDTAYKINIFNTELTIVSFLLKDEFLRLLKYCQKVEKQKQYFSDFTLTNTINRFFVFGHDQPIVFYNIFNRRSLDYICDLSNEYKYLLENTVSFMGDFYPDPYGLRDPKKDSKRVHQKVHLAQYLKHLAKIKLESPLFSRNGNILIVDNVNGEIVYFDLNDKPKQKISISFPFKKLKIKYIKQDELTDQIYYFVKENNKMGVYELNVNTGAFTSITSIKPFIENPTVYNGVLYYLDYDFHKETRELYKLPL